MYIYIYINRNNKTDGILISRCFPVTNVRTVLLHEFIHSKYKTIHELDPTVWHVAGRIVAEKWRVSYAARAIPLQRTRGTIYRRGDIERA